MVAATVMLSIALMHVAATPPDAKRACVAASDRAQEQRARTHLRAAREQMLVCTQPMCPEPVRRQCDEWLRQLDQSLPSVVVRLRDATGHDLTAARLLIDGELVATSLDGRTIAVDPGSHVFRLEPDQLAPIEEKLLIIEGEHNRIIVEALPADATPVATPSPAVEPVPAPAPVVTPAAVAQPLPAEPQSPRRSPVTWVLAAEGAVALGAFAALAIWGQSDYQACSLSPCAESMVTSLAVRRALAWTSLAVGVVSIGVAVWLYLTPEHPVALSMAPMPGGAVGHVSLGF